MVLGRCSNELDRDRSNRKAPRKWRLRRRPHQLSNRPVDDLARAAGKTENTMPYLLDAVRSYATVGEICDTLRGVFGTYIETIHV